MFDGLRRYSNSFFMILLVATVATLFGVNWGPGAQGCRQGSLQVAYVARVQGRTLSETDFRSSRSVISSVIPPYMAENPAVTGALREATLDGLIERELLAHEGERLGMHVSEEQVNNEFRACRFYISVGAQAENTLAVHSGPVQMPSSYCGGYGDAFDFRQFERNARRIFRRSVADLREVTARELLAQRVRDAVRASVSVSDEEMWTEYQRTHDTLAVKYLRFDQDFYRDLVRTDDTTAVAAWAATHGEDINHQWERRRDTLRGLHREIWVRHILVKFPEGATDAQKAETRARAEAIHTRVVAGEDFVRLARLYSDDPGSWRSGGDLGWRQPDGEQGYVPEFTRAANALQANGISPVTETSFGYHIIQLLGTREGDVAEADGKREIARTLYREARAPELAHEAAIEAQRRIAAGASLDDVGRELHTAALREFYRGEVPAPTPLPGNITLSAVERTDLEAPAARESETFARNGSVAGDIEHGEALTAAAFRLSAEHPLGDAPVQAGDDWFVLRLKDNSVTRATREEFNRQRQELMTTTYASMLAARQNSALLEYVNRLRQEAERRGEIKIGDAPILRPEANRPGENEEN